MYLTEREAFESRPAWVSSHHYINRTRTATPDMGTVEEDGRNILRAGTVFYGADGTAEGLVFHDVDLSHGNNQPVAVMVEGYVYASRLPEAVGAADVEALANITFEEYNVTEEDAPLVQSANFLVDEGEEGTVDTQVENPEEEGDQ